MVIAKDIAFEFESKAKKDPKKNLFGYLTVKGFPVERIIGRFKEAETITKDDKTWNLPDRVEVSIAPFEEGGQWVNVATLEWGEFVDKNGEFRESLKGRQIQGTDRFFSMSFPVSGLINGHPKESPEFYSCKLIFDENTYNYFTQDEEYLKLVNEGKRKPFQYYLEDATSWLTDDILPGLKSIFTEYDDWYVRCFPKGNMTKEIQEQRQAVEELRQKALAAQANKAATPKKRDIPGINK